MFKSCWTQHDNDCATQAFSEVKVWFWHNALARDPQVVSYIYSFDPFNFQWLAL